jgi:hypothetical protein
MADDTRQEEEIAAGDSVSANLEQALRFKRDSLQEQLQAIDTSISELQAEFTTKLEELHSRKRTCEETLNHIRALLKIETKSTDSAANVTVKNDDLSATDAALNLLQESHVPMHYKDMAVTLESRGVHISGVDPAATLLSRISRDERFKRVKRGTYGLKGWRKPKNKRMSRRKQR